ncbi:MAG: hypothetical protein EVA36_01530 [Flavobacteriales bacterium]|nr:MAG: hypothetical protein CBC56_001565 [Flavobacteriales bacterium TMED96]RZP11967.1 MAG: hypothetical protein EVA36_01530 [Flavobacteriales bacterium]|tara:strand:- start:963 stop:1160 length:198 start_codon:yes stop_codon:yes gene_type:complete
MEEENNQLEFYKTILTKVSFDRILFDKEFNKALIGLSYKDSNELRRWKKKFLFDKFHSDLIRKSS